MINKMLASDLVMIIGCATVLLMLVADFIYTEYLYRNHTKMSIIEKIKSEAITGDLVVVTLDTELDSDDS